MLKRSVDVDPLPEYVEKKGETFLRIERINENTLKFYISYLDIENRGFDREEIWYNRDRSEELFWQMMDEAHRQESFSFEGPLWIQVQALEKGMEIIVTRAQISQDGKNLRLPVSVDKHVNIPLRDQSGEHQETREAEAEEKDGEKKHADRPFESGNVEAYAYILKFSDFEDLVRLSHTNCLAGLNSTTLFVYKGTYYLDLLLPAKLTNEQQDDAMSRLLEFGVDTDVTRYVLKEYGKELIAKNALETIRSCFPL